MDGEKKTRRNVQVQANHLVSCKSKGKQSESFLLLSGFELLKFVVILTEFCLHIKSFFLFHGLCRFV